jgi:hypothetical protein
MDIIPEINFSQITGWCHFIQEPPKSPVGCLYNIPGYFSTYMQGAFAVSPSLNQNSLCLPDNLPENKNLFRNVFLQLLTNSNSAISSVDATNCSRDRYLL